MQRDAPCRDRPSTEGTLIGLIGRLSGEGYFRPVAPTSLSATILRGIQFKAIYQLGECSWITIGTPGPYT